jgi:hypothetical protein
MTSLLIITLLSGIAVTYVIEFFNLVTFEMFGIPTLNKFFSLPLSAGAVFSQIGFHHPLIIAIPAAAFISAATSKLINKPTIVSRLR